MTEAGFDIVKGDTAIVPVMLYSEPLAVKMADMLHISDKVELRVYLKKIIIVELCAH